MYGTFYVQKIKKWQNFTVLKVKIIYCSRSTFLLHCYSSQLEMNIYIFYNKGVFPSSYFCSESVSLVAQTSWKYPFKISHTLIPLPQRLLFLATAFCHQSCLLKRLPILTNEVPDQIFQRPFENEHIDLTGCYGLLIHLHQL